MKNSSIKHFEKLSLEEFHDIIALRINVFVVEQDCPYQELDGKDKNAYHLILYSDKNVIIGTARILLKGVSYPEVAIGRVVIDEDYRHLKLGHKIMEDSLTFIREKFGNENVRLSAQSHLVGYYAAHGFVSTGKEYIEDGIPHTEMLLKIN